MHTTFIWIVLTIWPLPYPHRPLVWWDDEDFSQFIPAGELSEEPDVVFKSLDNPSDAVAISPDGRFIADGGRDGLLRITTNTGQQIIVAKKHAAPIRSIVFNADGTRVASAGAELIDRPLLFAPSTAVPQAGPSSPKPVTREPITRSGPENIGKPKGGVVIVWEVETGRLLRRQEGYGQPIDTIAYSGDGFWLSSFDSSFGLDIRHSSTGKARLTLRREGMSRSYGEAPRVHTSFSDDTLRLISVAHEQGVHSTSVKLWDARRSRLRLIDPGESTRNLWAVCMRPDGQRFISGGQDGSLSEWDFDRGSVIRNFTAPHAGQPVTFLAYSPDGKRIVSGDEAGSIRLWDAGSGRVLQTRNGHGRPVRAVAFLPASLRLVCGGVHYKDFKNVPEWNRGHVEPLVVWDIKLD